MKYKKNKKSSIYMPQSFYSRQICSEEEEAVEESIAYSNEGASGSDLSVTADNNHVYFYSEVHRESILKLIKIINKLNVDLQAVSLTFSIPPPPIFLHINSYGGIVNDCLDAIDYIQGSKVPVYTIVEGVAASAGTVMSMVGKRRFIRKHSRMLIHQLSSGMWGTYHEIADEKENCDQMMEVLESLYAKYTKIPKKELKEILKHDLYWDSSKCLEMGLVDKII